MGKRSSGTVSQTLVRIHNLASSPVATLTTVRALANDPLRSVEVALFLDNSLAKPSRGKNK
jgi:hypothetical protein